MAKVKDKSKPTIETKVNEVEIDTVTAPTPPTPPIDVPIINEVQPKKRGRPSTGGSKYSDEDRNKFKKANYWKYPKIKEHLVELLDGTMPAKEVAKEVKLSISTFNKYKALAQLETGKRLMTSGESDYLERIAIEKMRLDKNK